MKRVVALVLSLALTPSASSQAFRCTGEGGVVYQDIPCTTAGDRLELKSHEPTADERNAAHSRLEREQRLIREYEAEHERARAAAEHFRARLEERRASREERCARYEDELNRIGQKDKDLRIERHRALHARYFSECVGRQ